jgi:hypothetical protein
MFESSAEPTPHALTPKPVAPASNLITAPHGITIAWRVFATPRAPVFTDTHTHRHTNTDTYRHTDTQTHRHTGRHTDRRMCTQADIQAHMQTDTRTHTHTDTRTQAGRQAHWLCVTDYRLQIGSKPPAYVEGYWARLCQPLLKPSKPSRLLPGQRLGPCQPKPVRYLLLPYPLHRARKGTPTSKTLTTKPNGSNQGSPTPCTSLSFGSARWKHHPK